MTLTRSAARHLASVGERFDLPPQAVRVLASLLDLGTVDPTVSTSVRDPNQAVDRHVADSLTALDLPQVRVARRIADIGSGAGWPGLALAAALPDAHVALVESAVRHCRYLERAVEVAGLGNVAVVNARAEAWPAGRGAHDLITARAVAALPVLCEYAAPLLAEGGCLVAWKGAIPGEEAADAEAAAAELGLERTEVRSVTPFDGARDHTLHVFRKTGPTPPRYPRRPGIATKRPLSATS
ncbi:MAG: 16S rRNA (guanine(527)-N(7))-methyltransferase RsmG [Solirubrobacteraceae bacterium]